MENTQTARFNKFGQPIRATLPLPKYTKFPGMKKWGAQLKAQENK